MIITENNLAAVVLCSCGTWSDECLYSLLSFDYNSSYNSVQSFLSVPVLFLANGTLYSQSYDKAVNFPKLFCLLAASTLPFKRLPMSVL